MDGGRDLGLGQKRREAERQREREARGHICNCTANGPKGCTKANIIGIGIESCTHMMLQQSPP